MKEIPTKRVDFTLQSTVCLQSMKFALVFSLLLLAACSRSNNLFLGRVETTIGAHQIVVSDCYRTAVPPPDVSASGFRYTPCRDADVLVRANQLVVNGASYGQIGSNDAILIDHGVVSVNGKRR